MRILSPRFILDRAYLWGFVALARLRFSGLFEMVDGTWVQHDLVLWNLEEFLGHDEHLRPTLDKTLLQAVSTRFKQDRQFRRDCFLLKLRGPSVRDCATTQRDNFEWPTDETARRTLFAQLPWESDPMQSRFTSATDYTWVASSFLLSLIDFALCAHPVYAQISLTLEQMLHHEENTSSRFINRLDGTGLQRDGALSTTTVETVPTVATVATMGTVATWRSRKEMQSDVFKKREREGGASKISTPKRVRLVAFDAQFK